MGEKNSAYIPLAFKRLQVDKFLSYRFIAEAGFVLLQQTTADFRILDFRDRVFEIGFFETVECDDDAIDVCERFIQITFSGVGEELDFLQKERSVGLKQDSEGSVDTSILHPA